MGRFVGLLGMATILGLAYLFSTNRKAIRLTTVLWGLGLRWTFAFFVLRFELGRHPHTVDSKHLGEFQPL